MKTAQNPNTAWSDIFAALLDDDSALQAVTITTTTKTTTTRASVTTTTKPANTDTRKHNKLSVSRVIEESEALEVHTLTLEAGEILSVDDIS